MLSFDEFKDKFNVHVDFITFNGWINAIKKFIQGTQIELTDNLNENLNLPTGLKIIVNTPKGSKLYYEYLTSNDNKPNCCAKWSRRLNGDFSWEKIFMAIHKIKDVKLKWLQIRIVHRILGTNVVLNAMGLMNTTNCGFCNGVRDSIDHFFWNCEHIQSFWDGLEKLVNEKCDHASNVKITCNLVLFGIDTKLKTDKVLT